MKKFIFTFCFYIVVFTINKTFSQNIFQNTQNDSIKSILTTLKESNTIHEFNINYTTALKKVDRVFKSDSLKNELLKIKIDFYQRNFRFNEVIDDITKLQNSTSEYYKAIGFNRRAYYLLSTSNTIGSLQNLIEAEKIAKKTNNYSELAITYNNIGNLYTIDSKYEKALKYYQKSLAINKDTNLFQKGLTLNNLFNIYFYTKNYKLAKHYHKELYKLIQTTNYETQHFIYYINDAEIIFINKGDYLKSLERAKEIAFKKKNNYFLGAYYQTLSKLDYNKLDYDNALKNINLSLLHFENEKVVFYTIEALKSKTEILKKQHKFEEAIKTIEKIDNIEKTTIINHTDVVLQEAELENLKLKQNKQKLLLEKKLKSQQIVIIISISLLILFILLMLFFYTKITKEKVINHHKNTLDKLTTLRLLSDVEKKEQNRIGKELHDIVGAQLILLKSIISKSNNCNNALAIQQVDKIYNKIRLISHDLFFKDFSPKNFKTLISDYIHNVTKLCNIEIEYYIQDLDENTDTKLIKYIYCLIQELVNNSIKHGDAKHILIDFFNNGSKIELVIEDNGKGFDKDAIAANNKGIGLNQIKKIIGPIKGSFEVLSQKGIGTTITISFYIQNYTQYVQNNYS